jgi:hypothetical protein
MSCPIRACLRSFCPILDVDHVTLVAMWSALQASRLGVELFKDLLLTSLPYQRRDFEGTQGMMKGAYLLVARQSQDD